MSASFEIYLRSEMDSVQKQLTEIKNLLLSWRPDQPPTIPNALTLFALIEKHTAYQKVHGVGKKGKPLTPGTIANYAVFKAYVQDYLKSINKNDESTSAINSKWYQDFERYSISRTKPLKLSTVNVAITFVKQVLIFGVTEGYVTSTVGLVYKLKAAEKPDPKPLTAAEITRIEEQTFVPQLQRTADAFIFLRYTGFHYIDGKLIIQAEQLIDENGLIYFQKIRQKTGEMATVPFHPKAQAIASKYGGLAHLPFIPAYSMNRHLKRIAKICGIQPITLSMARDTFADYYTNDVKMSDENLAAMLGHVDTSQLKRYRKVKIRRIVSEWKE